MNTDLKHFLSFTVFQGARIVCATLGMALLARLLGPSGLGRWAMIMAAATLVHLMFANWLQQDPFLRFGKPEWAREGTLRKIWSVRLPLLVSGLLLSLLMFTGLPWMRLRPMFQLSQQDGWLAFAFFTSLLISIEMQTLLQITGQMVRLALGPTLVAAVTGLLYLGLWWSGPLRYPVEWSLLGTIFITLVIWLGIGQRELRHSAAGFSTWNGPYVKEYLHYAWPILPMTLLGYAVNWGNQLLIHRSFSGREVGLYQSAFQVHALIVTLAVPFTTIILPRILDKHLEDPSIMKRYVTSIAPTLLCLWLLATLPVIVILPSLFIWVYGASFAEAVRPLTALLISTPLCALGQIYTVLYTVQGKLRILLGILLAMVLVNLAAAWVFIPPGGITITSVAAAFSLAFIVSHGLTFLYQHRILGEPIGKISALVIAALVFSLGQMMILSPLTRILWGLVGWGLLIGIARGVHALDRGVMDQLFTGRLQPLGASLKKLLIPQEVA